MDIEESVKLFVGCMFIFIIGYLEYYNNQRIKNIDTRSKNSLAPDNITITAFRRDLDTLMNVINVKDGNVGIGNPTPPYKFTVGKMWGINAVEGADGGGDHTTIYRNLTYDGVKGFVNLNPGSCSMLSMGGGSNAPGFVRVYAGQPSQSSSAGTPANLGGIFVNNQGYVGIGTGFESPQASLHINGNLDSTPTSTNKNTVAYIDGNTTDSGGTVLKIRRNNNTSSTLIPISAVEDVISQIHFDGVNTGSTYGGPSSIIQSVMDKANTALRPPGALTFRTTESAGSTERFRISSNGNILVNRDETNNAILPSLTGASKVMYIGNGTISPVGTNPVAGGILYVENGALKYKGSNGNITQLATA